MSETYDIVTVGSGHNGLVAAAYLAAAGKKGKLRTFGPHTDHSGFFPI